MLVRDAREIALVICHYLINSFLELPKMRLKYPREPIADSSPHTSVQNIRQDVSEPEVGGHYARGPLKSPASCRSQAPPSFLRHLDSASIQPQQRNEKIERDKKGKYDEEMEYVVEGRVGEEKGLKLQGLGSIR